MTYQSNEDSIEDGEVVELYKFVTAQGTTTITSANMPIIYNLETYIPFAISRSAIDRDTAVEDPRTLTVTAPLTFAIGLRYIQSVPPEKDIFTIFRGHVGSATPDSSGTVTLPTNQVIQY